VIRVEPAKVGKRIGRAALRERAPGVEIRQDDRLGRVEDLRGLAMK